MYLRCSFQDKYLSNNTPASFIDSSRLWLLIVKFGNWGGRLSFLLRLWKKEYLVYSRFRESLSATNHSFTLLSSLLTSENRQYVFLWVYKTFASSPYFILSRRFEAFLRSLTYKKNTKGVLILILEELHTSLVSNWFVGSISIYCFLLERKLFTQLWLLPLLSNNSSFWAVLYDLLYQRFLKG